MNLIPQSYCVACACLVVKGFGSLNQELDGLHKSASSQAQQPRTTNLFLFVLKHSLFLRPLTAADYMVRGFHGQLTVS
jgi:ferredoxin